MSAHTAGPWATRAVDMRDGYRTVTDAGGREVIGFCPSYVGSAAPLVETAQANAARIVACVNACEPFSAAELAAGLTTRTHAMAASGGIAESMGAELAALRAERDALAAQVAELRGAPRGVRLRHRPGPAR